MLDCTTEQYDLLYARWLDKPGDLLDLAEYQPGMKLLDLCGGTGVVTKEALRRGADPSTITLFDLNPRLIGAETRGVRRIGGPAERIGFLLEEWESFDVIVCRQAIAYIDLFPAHPWYPGATFFPSVWSLLKAGGRFAFNSFARPRWALKSYRHADRRYVEAAGWTPWPGGGRVLHLQWCLGHGWDVTLFRWHREADLLRALHRFEVDVIRSERGLRWICTRPKGSEIQKRPAGA